MALRPLAGLFAALALALVLLIALATSSSLGYHILESTAQESPESPEVRQQLLDEVLGYFHAPENALVVHAGLSFRERAHFREVKGLLESAMQLALVSGLFAVLLQLLAWRANSPRDFAAAIGNALIRAGSAVFLLAALLALQQYHFDAAFTVLHELVFDGRDWLLPADSLTMRCFPASYFETVSIWFGVCMVALAVLLCAVGAIVGGGLARHLATSSKAGPPKAR
jgi:uncharacterized membrane protein